MWTWLFTAGLISILAHIVLGDLLVYRQYRLHRQDWAHDGQPNGIFWRPETASWWSGGATTRRYFYKLLLATPLWVNKDSSAWRLLYGYRLTFGLALACTVGPLIDVFLLDMFG
jgi:hypothetical protein